MIMIMKMKIMMWSCCHDDDHDDDDDDLNVSAEEGHKLKDERLATPNQSQHVSPAKTFETKSEKSSENEIEKQVKI